MRRILSNCWLLLLFIAGPLLAQNITIRGQVTSSEDQSAIPGVNVSIKGTTRGTTTDATGNYTIEAPGSAVLVFSYIGYTTQEIPVNGRSTVNLALATDARSLNEVVVIGYGTVQRSKVTAAISTVKGAEIAQLVTPSFDQQLAGRAAGVQVTVPSGVIGQAPRIRIRGTNSITSGASPLIVVDGVPIVTGNQSGVTPTNPLGDINPQDIESYEVLKDGAATAIYGSRAANGVILITTKRGTRGAGTRVTLNVSGGVSTPINRFDLLNNEEFVQIANEKLRNAGATDQAFLDANRTNTDWQDYILRTGRTQDYNLGITGGGESTNYYISLGYQNITGALRANDQTRYSFLTNIDHRINRFVKVGAKLQVARTTNNGLNTGSNALSGNLGGAIRLFPNVPIYDATNPTGYNLSPAGDALGRGANTRGIDDNYTNLAFVLENNILRANTNRLLPQAYAQVNITDWLNIRTQIGADYTGVTSFLAWDPRHGDGRGVNGLISQTQRDVTVWNWQNILTLDRNFGQHNVTLTLGNENQKTNIASFTGGGQNFSDRFFLQNGLITGTFATQTSSGTFVPQGFDSFFGRILYSYADKYLASFSARNDGLSSLPLANRRGTFLGGSIGYRISQEDFYKNSGVARVMNDLKLRASYATVGNTDIGSFPYVGTFGSAQYASQNGIAFAQAGNPDLRWESSDKLDIGLDFGFLGNRITGSVEYFRNNISDLILAAPTAPSLGIPGNSINRNVGQMVNSGIEIAANFAAIDKDGFRWNVGANFSTVRNNITALNKGTDGRDQDIIFTYNINRVGNPISALYGYESAGVNPVNGNPLFVKGNGQIVQRDVNTGSFGFYTPGSTAPFTATSTAALSALDIAQGGDRRILGNTNPTFFGGITNTFAYKGFDLEVFVRFSGGNKVMNVTRQESLLNYSFQNNGREILRRWTQDNTNTDVPRIALGSGTIANFNGQAISRFVEPGDFVRIQNISLGYTFPKTLFGGAKSPINNLRLFAQVQNAFTFTRYTGLDPELNSNGDTNSQFGIDYNANPQIRFINFGLNAGF